MSNIFARSPYVIEIDEASQLATKLELFIWNGTGSAPSSPQYTFSKSIPASNNTATNYNICLLYTSPSPRDRQKSRMPSSA